MARLDRQILFTSLAFLAVAMKSRNTKSATSTDKIKKLAGLIEAYCEENIIVPSASAPKAGSEEMIDRIIDRHVSELREKEETRLPEDRETLIKIHDRLEHRKARRMSREFYGSVSVDRIADSVLALLDEEIDDDSRAKLA